MLAQTFSRFFIVIDYQLNKEYIAKYLCENKDKPVLKCNGKCQMMKKLQQEEKKDQQNPDRKAENKFEVISFPANQLHISAFYSTTTIVYPDLRESIACPFLTTPFHPPRV